MTFIIVFPARPLARKISLSLFAAVFLALFPLISNCAAAVNHAAAAAEIASALDRAFESHRAAEPGKAKVYVSEAYFDLFEGSGFEDALGAFSPSKKAEVEALFGKITGQISSGAGPQEVRASMDELMEKLRAGAASLKKDNGSGRLSLFVNSAIIILREGFEAILIISALAAYLVKTGKAEKVRVVYSGAVLKLYKEGKVQAAQEKAVDAYFGVFEAEKANMEIAVRQTLSFKRANELEKGFSELRKAMHKRAPAAEVKSRTLDLTDRVGKAAAEPDEKGVRFNAHKE